MWPRYQPDSELTKWFLERTRGGGKRMRRIYIVGLARKLVIALWRYLKDDTVPKGAVMKPMVTKPA
jgi:transposase